MADAWLDALMGHSLALYKKFPRDVLKLIGESGTWPRSRDFWWISVCLASFLCAGVDALRFREQDEDDVLVAAACDLSDKLWSTVAAESSWWLSESSRVTASKVIHNLTLLIS